MGVDLGAIFEKRECGFDDVPRVLAVDAFNTLYQFLTIIRQRDGTPLLDGQGRVTSHLSGLFYRTTNLLEKGITPVFVFDGEPSPLKRRTLDERAERKREALEKFMKAAEEGKEEEMYLYAQRTAKLGDAQVAESKRVLDLMGLPWVQAPSEGEAQCAAMASAGVVQAVASQDYDALLFGAPILIRNLTIAGRRKLPRRNMYVDVLPEKIDLMENLARLGITRQKLVWIGLLAGTDFNEGVRGIGAKKGLKLVQKHASLAGVLAEAGASADWSDVEQLFLHPPSVPVQPADLAAKPPQRDALEAFMVEEHDFSRERVRAALDRAFKTPAGTQQGSLGAWMS